MSNTTRFEHRIVYPDGSEETIKHYGMFAHSSGGFGFYLNPQMSDAAWPTGEMIFVSGANVRKIVPLGAL